MKTNKTKVILTLAALMLCVSSCSKKADFQTKSTAFYESEAVAEEGAILSDMSRTSSSAGNEGTITERKLIQRGSISLEVQSLSQARQAIEAEAALLGGYIESSSEQASWMDLTLRIPQESFSKALEQTAQLGKLKSKSISSSDVTDRYYDLETRISARKVLLERLEQHLREAKDMKEILEVEDKINSVTTELESMEGQMNRLSSQISYATIEVIASLPANQTENGFVLPDTGSKLRDFLGNTLSFFSGLLIALLYIVAFGVPLVLLLALLWWLCFGKIGLLKKLFEKINGQKK